MYTHVYMYNKLYESKAAGDVLNKKYKALHQVCVCIYIYIYIYIHTYVYICTHVYMYKRGERKRDHGT